MLEILFQLHVLRPPVLHPQEQIEELERLKKRLQAEIAGIDELIEDLKGRERRPA